MRSKKDTLLVCLAVFGTGVLAIVLSGKILISAYQRPSNGTYASKFGYASLMRRTNLPFPLKTVRAQTRQITEVQLAEGVTTGTPILVPIVQPAKVAMVLVQEGDQVKQGDLLAEMDPFFAQARLDSANLSLELAKAELQRVKISTPNTLARERPEIEAVNLEAARKQIAIMKEEFAADEKLFNEGVISRTQLLEMQLNVTKAEHSLNASQLDLSSSVEGQHESVRMAEVQLNLAETMVKLRAEELAEGKIYAPASGIVERVLVHPGEYSSSTGQPGFLLSCGLWFEAHLDQRALNKVAAGDTAEVQLELRPEAFRCAVSKVIPVVGYAPGGPEYTRPIRPLGTGAPEWPTTFPVRIAFLPEQINGLGPGLTGFARIQISRKTIAVPQGALSSFSAGSGLVTVLKGDKFEFRKVQVGALGSDGWVEISSGLTEGEKVAVDGQQLLEPGDKVKEVTVEAMNAR